MNDIRLDEAINPNVVESRVLGSEILPSRHRVNRLRGWVTGNIIITFYTEVVVQQVDSGSYRKFRIIYRNFCNGLKQPPRRLYPRYFTRESKVHMRTINLNTDTSVVRSMNNNKSVQCIFYSFCLVTNFL